MLGSENHFFNQDKATLLLKRDSVCKLLTMKGYGLESVAIYLKSYDYFCINPDQFDGATLVNDLCDIPDLDLDAMLHDWMYLVCNAAVNIRCKWMADMIFSKGMEQKGKGQYTAYSRFAGLTLSGIGFIPFARIKRGRITKEQKEYIENAYELIVKKGN